ncbi:hypothetical protein ACWEU6_37065 [Streptosporangium sandarakinum]|uniref:hypothetical protein n=1 Tax=Streptosporangium sandarakinum TaxID=1260955 RepID=UPI00369A3166
MRRPAVILALTAALTGCSATQTAAPAPAPTAITIGGSLSTPGGVLIDDGDGNSTSQTCRTAGGYTDIKEGAQVVITDAASRTIALGALEAGEFEMPNGSWAARRCVFPFSLSNVPAGQKFYGIEVSHRGRLQYTAEQITNSLQLTLGD